MTGGRAELIEYMKKDIHLLGAVMLRGQDIICREFKIDPLTKRTASALALSIFRQNFYDSDKTPIAIPNRNVDQFVRKGFSGGHVDVYKPRGDNFLYSDVNSLYPFSMTGVPMPIGKPKWANDLLDHKLSDLYGFLEAFVECPTSINKPLLPYRSETESPLIYPTGIFTGVYYSEELKYAEKVGYKIVPFKGYFYDKGDGMFDDCVLSLYNNRVNAREAGHTGLSYVYKLLMNSLFGRLGIYPNRSVT